MSVINVVNAHFIKLMTDAVLNEQWNLTVQIALQIILVITVSFIMQYIFKYSASLFSGGVTKSLKGDVASHILQLPVKKLESIHSGDLISRITNDLHLIQQFINQTFPKLLSQPFIFVAALIYLFTVHWMLAIFSIILMPIVTIIVNKLSERIEKYSEGVQSHEAQVNTMVRETIMGMPIIKAYDLKQTYYRHYENEIKAILKQKKHIDFRHFVMNCFTTVLMIAPYAVVALFGGYLTLTTNMTTGDLIAFIVLVDYISGPISELPHLFAQLRSSSAGFRRVYELFSSPTEQSKQKESKNTDLTVKRDRHVIQLRHVTFSYDEEVNVLKEVSIAIKEGETVAIVGLSGVGKSTIFHLLTHFYPHQSGEVYVQNRSIRKWDIAELRQQFAVVSQDAHLFNRSIEDNILCGNLTATREEIEAAARASHAHEFIVNLPNGYETIVGEGGVMLSGGQRQRMTLARAFLKKAPILLLDEATSALDTRTEMMVQQALERVMKGRTTIIIAHRLSTIKHADRVVVLDGGTIVENAPHDVLIRQDGVYKRLFQQQFYT
ncbi:ABC transporter ATP-binding protein [Bacillaceae bacterium SIJ1]|nr:ABC transporter ATP-binding protein [Litoribacterium kuwaitense]